VAWGANPQDYDAEALERTLTLLGRLFGDGRYFGVEATGFERVPEAPAMVVSNHSGGTTVLDAWGLGVAWYDHFGTARPLHPAAHEMVLGNRWTGPYMARRGVVRASREVARRVLEHWREDLLVMPGGDLDVWRPFRHRYRVKFGGRTGYARVALSSGVPVVPVAHVGAHHTFLVLTDGRGLAERVGLPKIARAHIWPVHLSLPWGLGFGPLPHLPPPTRLRYRFGRAVRPQAVGVEPGDVPTQAQIERFDRLVRREMQTQLRQLRDSA
jgi:1-acyl-sn-glycerol-3-phosphate acyltransferase